MTKFTSIPDPTYDLRSTNTMLLALRDAVRELQTGLKASEVVIQRISGGTGTGTVVTGGGGTSPSDATVLKRSVAIADIWN